MTKGPVLFLIAVILLAGCTDRKNSQQTQPTLSAEVTSQQTNKPEVTQTPTQTDSSVDSNAIVYTNRQYGFQFSLPERWKGYSIVSSEWGGYAVPVEGNDKPIFGPVITIRDPHWTDKTPTQDIPIMVIPIETWKSLLEGKFAIGANPIAPAELGRNDKYVFAINSRYNNSLLDGYKEVEELLQSSPLKALP